MNKRLYIGNLPFLVNDQDLQEIFSAAGSVQSAQVVIDKRTGRSKGYAFVEMDSEENAKKAIETFDGGEVDGRPLRVSLAKSDGPKKAETPAVAEAATPAETPASTETAASTETPVNA